MKKKKKTKTNLIDLKGDEIFEGDFVSLNGNMTADNSFGILPNAEKGNVVFIEGDRYKVLKKDELESAKVLLQPLYVSHFATCPNAANFRRK